MKAGILLSILASLALTSSAIAAERDSIYAANLQWTSEDGSPGALSDLAGTPVVLTLMYTRCGSACPMTIQRLKTIEKKALEAGSDVRFALVSLEPERDTPQKLADYKREKALGDRWHLFTGDDRAVRTLSVLLGYSYRPDETQGEIFHSNKIYLIDSSGRLVYTLEGLSSDTTELVSKLKELGSSKGE